MRRARKEAFKSSSTVVKLQEELKGARSELSVTKSDLGLHRVKVSKREQEAFEAQYKLVGAQEESEKMKQEIEKVKQESEKVMQESEKVMQESEKAKQESEKAKQQSEKLKQAVKVAVEESCIRNREVHEARAKLAGVQEELKKAKQQAKTAGEKKNSKGSRETLEADYKLAGVQEELDMAKAVARSMEEEKCKWEHEALAAGSELEDVRKQVKKLKHETKAVELERSTWEEEAFATGCKLERVQVELDNVREQIAEGVQYTLEPESLLTGSDLDRVCEELDQVKQQANAVEKEKCKWEQEAHATGCKLENVQVELEKVKQQVLEGEKNKLDAEAITAGTDIQGVREELEQIKQHAKIVEEEKCKREQEALETGNKLVGVQEELETVKRHLKVVEEERETLKTSLKEEEVARIAAEGKIALPAPEVPDEFSSPKKIKPVTKEPAIKSSKEHAGPGSSPKKSEPLGKKRTWDEDYESDKEDELTKTRKELARESKLRKRWHHQIEYMKMECQFKLCSCRRAEKNGETYVHDNSFADQIAHEQAKLRGWRLEQKSTAPSDESSTTLQQPAVEEQEAMELLIQFSPVTGTFKTTKEEEEVQVEAHSRAPNPFTDARPELTHSVSAPLPDDLSLMSLLHAPHLPEPLTASTAVSTATRPLSRPPSREASVTAARAARALSRPPSREAHTAPRRPLRPTGTNRPPSREAHTTSTLQSSRHGQAAKGIRVVNKTTTTTVPLAEVFSPPTMTREEALEQIRHRRERAKSFTAGTLTPRRQMVEGAAKRDISAPAVGTQKKTTE